MVEPRVLAIDLPFLRWPTVEIIDGSKHRAERQIAE
jgi:hypothetical protein